MAGLLDIFGSGGSQQLGLLGMSADDIQRARDDAQAQALYALAGRLFQGGKTGQSIAQGLQMGQQAYQQAMKGQLAERMQTAQIQEMLRQQQEQRAAQARQAQVEKLIGSAYRPAITTETPLMDMMGQQVMGPNLPQPARFDLQSVTPQLMAIPEGRTALAAFEPKYQEVGGELYEIPKFGGAPKAVAGTRKRETVTVGNVVLDKDTMQPIYTAPEKPTASIQEYNLAVSQGYKGSLLDYQTAKAKAGAGSTVVYPPGALVPDKGTAKDLQAQLLESGSRLSLYNQIESQFRPEYLQPKFKAGQAWSAIKEKSGANLSPEDKQSLAQFSQFKQNTLNNLSQTIKSLTGASMGVQEAARIEAGLPSAGQGIFDGDSPTEFQAKLNNTIKELRLVEARNAYILRKGLSFKDVPLDNIPKLINDRAAELAKQYQVDLKKATPTQINAIKRQLSVEFGITAD